MTIEIEKNVLFGGEMVNFCPVKSLGKFLIDSLEKYEDKIALIDAVTEKQVTYSQILNDSIVTAKCLMAAGLNVGDTIGIVSENRLEYPIPLLAALFIGVTVAPINSTYTKHELVRAFGLSKPKLIFISPLASDNVTSAVAHTDFVPRIIQFGDILTDKNLVLFKDFMQQYQEPQTTEFSPAVVNINEHIALILCSSGSTGLPKGVQLSHSNLIASIFLFKSRETSTKGAARNVNKAKMLGVIPFFHSYGCLSLLGILETGAKLVVLSRFDEELYVSCLQKYKINVLFAVPPLLLFLAKHPIVDKYDLSSVKIIYCSAAPLSAETVKAVQKRLYNNVEIRQGYGLSETTFSVLNQKADILKPGSVGVLTQGTYCKVVDPDTGNLLGIEQAGELYFKGPLIMKGYIGDDGANRNAMDNDGWLKTGDVGYYDSNYNFFIVDRLKELIKYKGYQVPPAEIESVLLTNPKIKDTAVIGMPNEICGELPMAFVVIQTNAKLTENEVIQYVADRVSPTKRLRGGVRFIDEIPKNTGGKILRRELRALLTKSKL